MVNATDYPSAVCRTGPFTRGGQWATWWVTDPPQVANRPQLTKLPRTAGAESPNGVRS